MLSALFIQAISWSALSMLNYWRSMHVLRPTQPATNWTANEYRTVVTVIWRHKQEMLKSLGWNVHNHWYCCKLYEPCQCEGCNFGPLYFRNCWIKFNQNWQGSLRRGKICVNLKEIGRLVFLRRIPSMSSYMAFFFCFHESGYSTSSWTDFDA